MRVPLRLSLILVLALVFGWSPPVHAQTVADPRVSSTISANGGTVTLVNLPSDRGSASVTVSNYCTCTLVIEGRGSPGGDWEAISGAPTISADGVYTVTAAGLDGLRVRASAWSLTTTTIVLRVSSAGGGGGGSGSGGNFNAADFNAAFGTAGTPDSQVMSVQGVIGGQALDVAITGSSTITIDSELGAAAAAADNMANPTSPFVLAALMCWDSTGSNWDRCLSGDAVYDVAVIANGPQVMGECDDSSTDPVDEGDAGRIRIDCTTKALRNSPMASAIGGATLLKFTSEQSAGDNEDEHAVCTAACTLYTITATNHAAAGAFLRCENDTAANTTPGSETVELDLEIPGNTAGAGITFAFPVGANWSTALTCWLATGEADTDTVDVGANDVKLLYSFKQ